MQNYDCFSNLCIDYFYGTFTNCGKNWCGINQTLPYSKFYYVTGGECEIKTDKLTFRGKPGRLIFIPAKTRHSFYHVSENYVKKYWMHFDIKTANENMNELIELPLYVDIPENKRRSTENLFEKIFAETKKTGAAANLRLKAYIVELFALYVETACADKAAVPPTQSPMGAESKNPDESSKLSAVIDYINRNLDKRLSVEELAGMMHLHPNYFIRMFKKNVGVSPLKYINKKRFEKTISLFVNEELPITDVMTEVGFDDYSAFSNFFKSYSGYCPKKYRQIFIYRD